MSDSDSELLTNNVFTFRNESTIVSAKGPNINASNIRGLSFGDRVMSSTLQLPRNFDQRRYAESSYDPRMYRRETSPMSVASACDMRGRSFHSSRYARGMSSQRSMVNGRSGSPTMSIRSIDSSASVSAKSIAMAFKNVNFNKYDLRIIKEAYNRFMKHRVRKKIEKRRNLRLFLKEKRRTSGYDSGEMGSDSSISSDDRSHISSFKENRSTKTDILSDFRRSFKESNMYKDCTNNFRQNSFRNKVGPINFNSSSMSSFRNTTETQLPPRNESSKHAPVFQKDRFKNGFLLPSQRFNKSVASSVIHEDSVVSNNEYNKNIQNRNECDTDSEQDEIFSRNNTEKHTNNNQRKRSIDTHDDVYLPSSKRTKVASPCKNSAEALKARKEATVKNNTNVENNTDFVFAKPVMPVKKTVKERLLAKSREPLTDAIITPTNTQPKENPIINTESTKNKEDDHNEITQDTTDVSMRPSFIKRKLFTQKLDVAENKNMSGTESPQGSIYSAIQKERHKARKLVTSQSCMSHDIQDESNLLDLIHKIVPASSMNITSQTNKTDIHNSKSKNDEDKWDVTSIISTRIDGNVSDTFTDEEIFNDKNATIKSTAKPTAKVTKKSPEKKEKVCKVVVEKMPIDNINTAPTNDKNGPDKPKLQKCIRSFWDTDSESDIECRPRKIDYRQNQQKDAEKLNNTKTSFQGFSSMFKKPNPPPKLCTTLNNTLNSTQRLNSTTFKIKSHRSPKLKEIVEKKNETIKSYFEPSSTNSNKLKSQSKNSDVQQKNNNDVPVVQENPKNNKKTNKENKKNDSTKKQNKKSQEKNKPQKVSNKDENKISNKDENKISNKDENKASNTHDVTQKSKTANVTQKETASRVQNKKSPNPKNKDTAKKIVKKTPEKKVTNKKSGPKSQEKSVEKEKTQASKTKRKETPIKKDNTQNKKPKNTKTVDKTIDKVHKSPAEKIKPKDNKKSTKTLKVNTTLDSTLETNNNKTGRAIRSCRISKNNTLNNSSIVNLTLHMSINKSLRSRSINISPNNNLTKKKQKINTIERFFR